MTSQQSSYARVGDRSQEDIKRERIDQVPRTDWLPRRNRRLHLLVARNVLQWFVSLHLVGSLGCTDVVLSHATWHENRTVPPTKYCSKWHSNQYNTIIAELSPLISTLSEMCMRTSCISLTPTLCLPTKPACTGT